MKTLRLENTSPFQGLAELVAYDEGLFEKEGIKIEWIDRESHVDKSPTLHITDHRDASRFASHGSQMEQGKADMYNACEWGNYSRVETTKVGSRQVGRRSIVTYAAIVVRGDSDVQTPQQLAGKLIGLPYYNGTHYLALQMLEGFIPRELIKTGRLPNGSKYRFKALMDGLCEATTLTEPYITLAEKKGCRARRRLLPSRHRGRVRPRRCRNLHRVQPRGARGGAADQCQQVAPTCTTSSTTIRTKTRRSPSSRSPTCARAGSTWSIRRRSRRKNCSAPTSG